MTTTEEEEGAADLAMTKEEESAADEPEPRLVLEMIRAELPEVTQALLKQAKAGDTRAAAVVLRMLSGEAKGEEGEEDERIEAAMAEFDRELEAASPLLAAQVLALIVRAGERAGTCLEDWPGAAGDEDDESDGVPALAEADPPEGRGDPV